MKRPQLPPLGECPVDRTLNVIGYRWAGRVVYHLMDGRKRHGELLRLLPGISPKTLTDRLRELEHTGFVTREAFNEIPPRVEYALTDRGRSLGVVFDAMAAWGEADAAGHGAARGIGDRPVVPAGEESAVGWPLPPAASG